MLLAVAGGREMLGGGGGGTGVRVAPVGVVDEGEPLLLFVRLGGLMGVAVDEGLVREERLVLVETPVSFRSRSRSRSLTDIATG